MGGSEEERVRLLVGLSSRMRDNGQKMKLTRSLLNIRKCFLPVMVTQRGRGFSILEILKNLSEHSPAQLALRDSA